MARAIWTGVLTFGLVTVPVGLYTATEDHTVHFHQLERGTGDRVRYKKVNERTGKEVESDDIVKGYDIGDGEYVVVEPEELEEIAPGKSRVIDMAGFVDLDQVEPVFFERTYYVAPQNKEYLKVYELLRAALERSQKAGIATFTMRNKEYLTALRAQDEVLVLHTMHWADEVRDPRRELDLLPDRRTKVGGRELDTAQQLIDALSMDWNPDDFHDTSEERVQALVDAKREGRQIVSEAGPPEATNVIDLMEALQNSVERARSKDGGRPKQPAGELRRLPSRGDKNKGGKQGSKGAGDQKELEGLTKKELYELAADRDIAGRSKMNRDQLVKALKSETTAA
ncbi:Ku protein [Streptomyces pristinaespiralis]|uniref:non-homologous end joining protein Ku n=1 Tax=Streptomyces pristinaespiralis TaxID=38300 RepID=UPI0033DD0CA1